MKHKILLLLPLAICGCNSVNPDFVALEDLLTTTNVTLIGLAGEDTAFVALPATDKMRQIFSHEKTTAFWANMSNDDIMKYATPDSCILNAKLDYNGNCPYRMYCGGAAGLITGIATGATYAVEICK